MEKVTHITDHVFDSPKRYMSAMAIIVLSIVLGIMFDGVGDPAHMLETALVIFLVPGFLASVLAVPIANGLGGRLYLRRALLMTMVCQGTMVAIWVFWFIIDLFRPVAFKPVAIFMLAFPMFLWHTILSATSNRRFARTVWSSALHPVLGLIGFHMMIPVSSGEALFAARLLVVMLISVSVFTSIARAPLKRIYNWDGLDLVKLMLAHWTEGISEGTIEMEQFFDSFAVEAKVPISLVAFRRTSDKGLKGIMVVPGAHPGPFGHLSGSNMPGKLMSVLSARKGPKKVPRPFVMVPHSATTHDMNPSTSNEAIKIGAKARKMLDQVEYSSEATRFSRQGKEVSICSQSFGDSLVMVHDPSLRPRDDLDEYIGKDVTKHARREGIENALFIDAHNCIEPGSENVHHHTQAGETVVELAETAIERSKTSKRETFKIGFAQDKEFTVEGHGIGPAGIQVMVAEIGGQRTAYVLIDGNNIVAKMAERIGKKLDIVNRSVIMTTDNHIANVTMGGFNPIGKKIRTKELVKRITAVVEQAIDDLEDCEVGGASDTVMIRVFGPGATARLTATINSTMSVMKLGAVSGLALSFTGTVVWYQLLNYLGHL